MTIKEYTNKFKNMYWYAKDVYPMKDMKSDKFTMDWMSSYVESLICMQAQLLEVELRKP